MGNGFPGHRGCVPDGVNSSGGWDEQKKWLNKDNHFDNHWVGRVGTAQDFS